MNLKDCTEKSPQLSTVCSKWDLDAVNHSKYASQMLKSCQFRLAHAQKRII